MKNIKLIIVIALAFPHIVLSQYTPMTIKYGTYLPPDTCSIRVITADCFTDSVRFEGYIQGGLRPYQYKWEYVSNNTVAQELQPANIIPGHDYIIDILDRFDVSLNVPQPRLNPTVGWQGTFRLTVIDSRIETTNPPGQDLHDTLTVIFKYKWPDQLILPNPVASVPSCDTCIGDYLFITPQRGTPPYDILLIGEDNNGNHVEHYGQNAMGLNVTNLAQLAAGCYDIYVTDSRGCQEKFNYCFTTTDIEEIYSDPGAIVRVTDLMGRDVALETNKTLILHYSNGTTRKLYITE